MPMNHPLGEDRQPNQPDFHSLKDLYASHPEPVPHTPGPIQVRPTLGPVPVSYYRNVSLFLIISTIIVVTVYYVWPPSRSVQAFCDTFQQQAVALHSKYTAESQSATTESQSDPLGAALSGIGDALQMQGDLATMFDRMDKVAPDQIEPDVAAVRDTFKKEADSVSQVGSNPLGAVGSLIISDLQGQGSYQRVNDYIKANCNLSFMNQGASQSTSGQGLQSSNQSNNSQQLNATNQSNNQEGSRDSKRQTDLNAIDSRIEAFYAQYGFYPTLADLKDSSFLSQYMKGFDPTALNDPKGGTITATPAGADHYGYTASQGSDTAATCDNTAKSSPPTDNGCGAFDVQALLESNGNTYEKKSNT